MAIEFPARLRKKWGKERVSIVGFGPSQRHFDGRGVVWAINDVQRVHLLPKADMIIAMDDWKRDYRIDPGYVGFISNMETPVCTSTAYQEWPCLFEYPIKPVVKMLGRPWLDNTWSYAMALAIYLGFREIRLYGADFWTADTEGMEIDAENYAAVKYGKVPSWFRYYMPPCTTRRRMMEPGGECLSHLIGFALGRGIDVFVPEGTALMDLDREQYLYGYENQPM